MKFEPLNIEKHDPKKVSELIYETELRTFRSLIGKDESEAIKNIESLICMGNNLFGNENIHVVSDNDNEVLGILVSFKVDDITLWKELKAYSKILNFFDLLKYLFKETLVDGMFTDSFAPGDYYLCNVAVDHSYRGQGIGKYIMANALELADGTTCERVVLRVTLKNEKALKLYKRFGFKVTSKNIAGGFLKDENTYDMELLI